MHHPTRLILVVGCLIALVVSGCRQAAPPPGPTEEPGSARTPVEAEVAVATPPPPVTVAASVTAPPATTLPTTTPPMPTPTSPPPPWPPSPTPAGRFGPAAFLPDIREAAAQLAELMPPLRDDVALARAYWEAGAVDLTPPASSRPVVGERQLLNVLNTDSAAIVQIEAELLAAGTYAYFWFDVNPAIQQPDPARLAEIITGFDRLFEAVTAAFGYPESLLPTDGPQIHVVSAAPEALCASAAACGVGGYFSDGDALPLAANPNSNQRKMFVMNAEHAFGASFLSTLAHELRHLVEAEYDQREADWQTEGSAVLAEELAGWPGGALASGNGFLSDPDLPLMYWSVGQSYRHYGQGYLLSRYLYERLGPDLYREFARHPADGLAAVDALAAEQGLDLDGLSLWLDWLVALAIHDRVEAPAIYRLGSIGLETASMTDLTPDLTTLEASVNQFAGDYYRLTGSGNLTLTFEGSLVVPLLDVPGHSGASFWYAGRTNSSESRLTRAVDLRDVERATLHYAVYHDIELQYDFAYVSVSSDGGASWRGLVAPGMQAKGETHDPANVSLTERFYNGYSGGWLLEEIDLSPYAGQEILLRFSYVTDSVLAERGPALDNIAIPEIGFYDNVEMPASGWLAEGFTRATSYLPQEWHVQLITFAGGVPEVITLPVGDDGRLEYVLNLEGEAILIVAASAPVTLEPALYRLQIAYP